MIEMFAALALATKPAMDLEFFCPVRNKSRQQANFWFEQNPRWRVQFVGYLGRAEQVSEARRGAFARIIWRTSRGQYAADINWSNSWGPRGVASVVKLKDSSGTVFEGNCYPNGAAA